MQLEHAFAGVEDAAEVLAEPAGDVLDVDLGHQVQVELGPQLAQRCRQDLGALLGRVVVGQLVRHAGVDELRQRRQVPGRLVREAPPDHHRLQVDVEPRGDQRLVAAGHHHELVDEFVVGAAPLANLVAQRPFLGVGHLLDDEHLEVRDGRAPPRSDLRVAADRTGTCPARRRRRSRHRRCGTTPGSAPG